MNACSRTGSPRLSDAPASLLEAIPLAAFVTDVAGALVGWNAAATLLWGGPVTPLRRDGVPLGDAESPAATCLRLAGPVLRVPLQVEASDGRIQDVHADAMPWRRADGAIAYVVTSVREAVPSAVEHYRAALAHSPLTAWVADAEGFIVREGPPGTPEIGDTAGHAQWTNSLHPEDQAPMRDGWAEAIRSGRPYDIELRRMGPNGYRWSRVRAAPRRDGFGRITSWYGSLEDIHDLKLADLTLEESRARAVDILKNNPDALRVLDLDGRIVFANPASIALAARFNSRPQIGMLWHEWVGESDRGDCLAAVQQAAAGQTTTFTKRGTWPDGQIHSYKITTAPIRGTDGQPIEILTVGHDVTENERLVLDLQNERSGAEATARRLTSVLESTDECVLVVDHEQKILYVNGNASQFLGPQVAVVGISLRNIYREDTDQTFGDCLTRASETRTQVSMEGFHSALGCWLRVKFFPTVDGISIFFRDITERHHAEQERRAAEARIARMALHDVLTGLGNRSLFHRSLTAALNGSGAAMLFLDIDGFKSVNDTCGHVVGDALLRQIAERLRRSVRPGATIARLGGDEFAIIAPETRTAAQAMRLANTLIRTISKPYEIDDKTVVVGASVGVTLAEAGLSVEEVLRRSDAALHHAKSRGRGQACRHDAAMDDEAQRSAALKLSLGTALIHGELEVHYQPLVKLAGGRLTSFEALLRWRHPERGLIPPIDFIPLAEQTGFIIPIGEWVLRTACKVAAGWPEDVSIAVNLSPVQFGETRLAEMVADALADSGLAPHRLELEVTESVMLRDSGAVLRTMRALRELGVQIAMDDFGTGYSSLSYLRKFPFTSLKLDRSFIADLPDDKEAVKIVRTMTRLGMSLGMTITAEGVEDARQEAQLRLLGCQKAQGFLYSRPVPVQQVAELIATARLPASSAMMVNASPVG